MMDPDKTAIGVMDDRTQMVSQPAAEATQYAAQVECPVCKTPNPPSETYCMDCGFLLASAPVTVKEAPQAADAGALVTPDGTREFPLMPGENTVGRENADILLSDNTVSRKHAKIIVADGRALVQDIGSANGTRIDGQQLAQGDAVELKDGADVEFGRMLLKYHAPAEGTGNREEGRVPEAGGEAIGEGEAPAELAEGGGLRAEEETPVASVAEQSGAAEASPEGAETPSPLAGEGWGEGAASAAVAKLISKDGSLAFDLLEGTATIGRRQGANDIVVPDPYCSGRHADLSVEGGAYTLTDVGSTNGTSVNGVKLEPNVPRQVQPGDEITFGQTAFAIEVTS